MLHLIWYIIVGLIAGFVAKSLMHTHLTLLWTIVPGIVGSIIGGAVTHLFFTAKWRRPVPSCWIKLFPYLEPFWFYIFGTNSGCKYPEGKVSFD